MSRRISRHGEYSDHVLADSGKAVDRFVCSRCAVLAEDELFDAFDRLREQVAQLEVDQLRSVERAGDMAEEIERLNEDGDELGGQIIALRGQIARVEKAVAGLVGFDMLPAMDVRIALRGGKTWDEYERGLDAGRSWHGKVSMGSVPTNAPAVVVGGEATPTEVVREAATETNRTTLSPAVPVPAETPEHQHVFHFGDTHYAWCVDCGAARNPDPAGRIDDEGDQK